MRKNHPHLTQIWRRQIVSYLQRVHKEIKLKLKTANFPCHLPWKKIILFLAGKVENLTSVLVFRDTWRLNPCDNQINRPNRKYHVVR